MKQLLCTKFPGWHCTSGRWWITTYFKLIRIIYITSCDLGWWITWGKLFTRLSHSHKKWKDNLETRAILIEISMLKFTEGPPKKQKHSFPWRESCLQAIFVLIWMKQVLIWFNLQRDGTGNGLSNIKDTFPESVQLQMSVLHQIMCIFKAGLSSSDGCWAKYKPKILDVSDPNQNVETICNSKLKFT